MLYRRIDDATLRHELMAPEDVSGTLPAIAAAIGFITVSAILYLLNTTHGIGILPDSTRYMGLSERPYDAPLYAWLIRAVAAGGIDIANAAKLAGFVLVCLNTLLIWHILIHATRRIAPAAIGTALAILAPQFVAMHSVAMSEPLFVTGLLGTAMLARRYWETRDRAWLAACGLAIAATSLVRFSGPPLGAAIALCLLIARVHPMRRRVSDVGLLIAFSAAPFLVWTVLAQMVTGHSLGRTLSFNGNMDAHHWLTSFEMLTVWLMPSQVPFPIRAISFCLVAAAAGWLFAHYTRRAVRQPEIAEGAAMLPVMLGVFTVFYLLFMVLAVSIEANLYLTSRYAMPIYVTSTMALTLIVAGSRDTTGATASVRRGLVMLALAMLVSHSVRTAQRTRSTLHDGFGFTSRLWKLSPTIRAVDRLPANASIYSNGPDVTVFLLRRPIHFAPARFELRTGRPDPEFPFIRQIAAVRAEGRSAPTYLVFFDHVDWRFYLASEADLVRLLGLRLIDRERDGRVYAVPGIATAAGTSSSGGR